MRDGRGIPAVSGFFIFLIMFIVTVLAQMVFAESASAGEETADPPQLYVYLLMNGRQGEVEYHRIEVPPRSSCVIELARVELGAHSRATKFCSATFERAGSALFSFKKLRLEGDGNAGD